MAPRIGAALTATWHDFPAANSPTAFDAKTAAFAVKKIDLATIEAARRG